jgi:preprotein translocase subunit SecG
VLGVARNWKKEMSGGLIWLKNRLTRIIVKAAEIEVNMPRFTALMMSLFIMVFVLIQNVTTETLDAENPYLGIPVL